MQYFGVRQIVVDPLGSILPFIRKSGAVFDDYVTEAMGLAFGTACKELHDRGQPQIVYEIIARRIIEAAKNGERNPTELVRAGLAALGISPRQRTRGSRSE